jgi:hypothetical protein
LRNCDLGLRARFRQNGDGECIAPGAGAGGGDRPADRAALILHRTVRRIRTRDWITRCHAHDASTLSAVFEKCAQTVGEEAPANEIAEHGLKLFEAFHSHRHVERASLGDADEPGNIGAQNRDRVAGQIQPLEISAGCCGMTHDLCLRGA